MLVMLLPYILSDSEMLSHISNVSGKMECHMILYVVDIVFGVD